MNHFNNNKHINKKKRVTLTNLELKYALEKGNNTLETGIETMLYHVWNNDRKPSEKTNKNHNMYADVLN